MKTKFFKKLSFVLAVAMVLSVFAPAAGAFAAGEPKLNSTKKYLHLSGKPGSNEFNFDIKNKVKGWKYFWESADEAVAEVNEKNGVVIATGVGKTKITCTITDADGEEVAELVATVTVRDNIETVTIKNPVEKLNVGEPHDFNRSFVTLSGSTKKTDSITRWEVEPDTAEIDDKGVFVAKEAGEYTITARSFQSKAKHKDWTGDPEKYADYVLASDTTKVVVSASIVDVKQVNKTQFTVEFDSSMKDTDLAKDKVMVYQVINGKQYNTGTEKVSDLSLDATGKFATVTIYGNLVGKTVYQFVYGDLKGEFTAASTDWSDIAGIRFDDFSVKTDGTEFDMLDKLNAVNADGIVIKSGHEIASYVNFTYDGDFAYGWLNGTKIFINKNGHTARINAKYTNFIYDEVTKTYKETVFEDSAVALGVDVMVNNNTMQYAVAKSTTNSWDLSWKNDGFTIPAADSETYDIYTRFKKNTDPSWVPYTEDFLGDNFNYVSTNSDLLVIDGINVFGIAPGKVTVLVQDKNNNNVVVGAFDITILNARAYAEATANMHSVTIGNFDLSSIDGWTADDNESRTITITNKDSMGHQVKPYYIQATPTLVAGPSNMVTAPEVSAGLQNEQAGINDWNYGFVDVNVTAAGATPGRYQYKFDIEALGSRKTLNVYVEVLNSLGADKTKAQLAKDVSNWRVEFDRNDVDFRWSGGEETLNVSVYGYNRNGARIYKLDSNQYHIVVDKTSGGGIKSGATVTSDSIKIAYKATSGNEYFATGAGITFIDLTNYVATAIVTHSGVETVNKAVNTRFATGQFKVSNSTSLEFSRNRTLASENLGTVAAAIQDVYTFKQNGNEVDESTGSFEYKVTKGGVLTTSNGLGALAAGENVYIHEVYYYETVGGGVIRHTFKVNQTITITR